MHLAAAKECCPYVEYLPSELAESQLRTSLVQNELKCVRGQIEAPLVPGLGVELNREALERFRVD